MNIAILYICTGKYRIFWDDFYKSCKDHFLINHNIKYFVFTDDQNFPIKDDVFLTFKECQGFPNDSLFRFDYFLEVKQDLLNFDFIYFFNSNMKFISKVDEEILPDLNLDKQLVGVLHPGYYNKNEFFFPYEKRYRSLAYILYKKDKHYNYFMGGVNGGASNDYIELIETCNSKIKNYYSNSIIAKFHDESHINNYFNTFGCKSLPPIYGWPEGKNTDLDIKIIIRDKTKIDLYFKKHTTKIYLRLYNLFKTFIYGFKWKYIDRITIYDR